MSSRLAPQISMAELRQALERTPAVGRIEPWLSKLARLCQPVPPLPRMLDRLLKSDAIYYRALQTTLEVYGLPDNSDLGTAAEALGANSVRQSCLIVGLHLCNNELCKGTGLSAMQLSQQAVATASATSALLGDDEENSAFGAGLLANIGVGLMVAIHGKEYMGVARSMAGGSMSLAAAERFTFGHDHQDMGSLLLGDNNFPMAVVRACGEHAADDSSGDPEMTAIWLGEAIAHQLGFDGGFANTPRDVPAATLRQFGFTDTRLAKFAESVTAEIKTISNCLKQIEDGL